MPQRTDTATLLTTLGELAYDIADGALDPGDVLFYLFDYVAEYGDDETPLPVDSDTLISVEHAEAARRYVAEILEDHDDVLTSGQRALNNRLLGVTEL